MDKKILRLLIVDDSPDEADLAVAALRTHGYMLKQQRVHDLASLQLALDKGHWDALITEFTMAHFGALMAHDVIKRAGLDIPFVVLTRTISDADLEKVMHAGAHDVVLKSQLVRLAPAMARELRAADDRRALREASAKRQELENKNRAIVQGSREALCYTQDGMHVDANQAYLQLFGYASVEELTGIPVMNLVDKDDHLRFKEFLRKGPESQAAQEFTAVKGDGTRFTSELTLSPIVLNGEPCLQISVADVSKRKAVESKLQYMNQHDPLTGLYNRHHFLQELAKAVDVAKRGEGDAALLFMDLLQLKQINDAMTYAAGDRLLIKVARILREFFGDKTVLARMGGDEFAALLNSAEAAQAQARADALQKALKAATFTEGTQSYHCECHLAVSSIDRNTKDAHQVLSDAYHATQRARPPEAAHVPATTAPAPVPSAPATPTPTAGIETAKARPKLAAAAAGTNHWAVQLQTALDKDSFTLAYQPIVNLHGEAVEYFEVLVRLVGEKGEVVAAGQFMPAAEKSGLCAMIDRWVVRNAIEALGAMHREGRAATFFINLSPTAFKDADLLPSAIRWLRDANVKPGFVIFEADEPDVVANRPSATTFIKAARKIGCHFAIDNFGRHLGASEYLRELPVEYLKIDGNLIRSVAGDAVAQTTLRAVLQVAQALEMKTIAKSVEKAENLASLWNVGVDYVQGHYFEGNEVGESVEATLSSDTARPPNWTAASRAS